MTLLMTLLHVVNREQPADHQFVATRQSETVQLLGEEFCDM